MSTATMTTARKKSQRVVRGPVHTFTTHRKDKAVITCPFCRFSQTLNPEQRKVLNVPFLVNCLCGNSFKACIEFRLFARKEAKLEGEYFNSATGVAGGMTTDELSLAGLIFTTDDRNSVIDGDILDISISLDDETATELHRKVRVKKVDGRRISCDFTRAREYDPELALYLRS